MILQQMQNLAMRHGVAARGLQRGAVGGEFEHERVREFLAVQIRHVREFEFGQMILFHGDTFVDVHGLGDGEGEIPGFVDGDDAAFPELSTKENN